MISLIRKKTVMISLFVAIIEFCFPIRDSRSFSHFFPSTQISHISVFFFGFFNCVTDLSTFLYDDSQQTDSPISRLALHMTKDSLSVVFLYLTGISFFTFLFSSLTVATLTVLLEAGRLISSESTCSFILSTISQLNGGLPLVSSTGLPG